MKDVAFKTPNRTNKFKVRNILPRYAASDGHRVVLFITVFASGAGIRTVETALMIPPSSPTAPLIFFARS